MWMSEAIFRISWPSGTCLPTRKSSRMVAFSRPGAAAAAAGPRRPACTAPPRPSTGPTCTGRRRRPSCGLAAQLCSELALPRAGFVISGAGARAGRDRHRGHWRRLGLCCISAGPSRRPTPQPAVPPRAGPMATRGRTSPLPWACAVLTGPGAWPAAARAWLVLALQLCYGFLFRVSDVHVLSAGCAPDTPHTAPQIFNLLHGFLFLKYVWH